MEIDERGLMLDLYRFAKQSPDPSTQNAAMLLDGNYNPLIKAVNLVSPRFQHLEGVWENPKKQDYVTHAEENVIIAAGNANIPTYGKIMFACFASCKPCARTIVTAGIKELWTHLLPGADYPKWAKQVEGGLRMIHEAGIPIHFIGEQLSNGDVTILRGGKEYVV